MLQVWILIVLGSKSKKRDKGKEKAVDQDCGSDDLDDVEKDTAAAGFLASLLELRVLILQDSVQTMDMFPDLEV